MFCDGMLWNARMYFFKDHITQHVYSVYYMYTHTILGIPID